MLRAEVSGAGQRVMIFVKLLYESNEEKFSCRRVEDQEIHIVNSWCSASYTVINSLSANNAYLQTLYSQNDFFHSCCYDSRSYCVYYVRYSYKPLSGIAVFIYLQFQTELCF